MGEQDESILKTSMNSFIESHNKYAFAQCSDRSVQARIETGTSHDTNTIKRIEIFFKFPDVALGN